MCALDLKRIKSIDKYQCIYDIHGFTFCVEGIANKIFLREYGWAKVDEAPKISLYVKPSKGQEILPTKSAGSLKGMYIPFKENEDVLWYEEGVPLNVLMSYCEALMYWPDKTILHAGGVAKEGEALLFVGGGNVGKTSIVLNLLREEYEYLGDDWIVIDENKAYPLPKTIRVFDYNLKNKEIAKSVLGIKRFLYKPFFKLLELGTKYAPHRYLRYGLEVCKPMFHVDLKKLNPKAKIALPTKISKVFYLERENVNKIKVIDDVTPEELAERMAYINLYEWNFFFKEYYRYAYLYGFRNIRIENIFHHYYDIMYGAFKRANLYRIIIPQKMDLTKVKMTPIIGR